MMHKGHVTTYPSPPVWQEAKSLRAYSFGSVRMFLVGRVALKEASQLLQHEHFLAVAYLQDGNFWTYDEEGRSPLDWAPTYFADPPSFPPLEAPEDTTEDQATDLHARLDAMSKVLECSGVIDEHRDTDAYSTILEAMNFVQAVLDARS